MTIETAKKKRRKPLMTILLIALGATLAALLFTTIANARMISVTKDRIISAEEAATLGDMDCVMVLGCGVRDNGRPSAMLADRLETGVELFELGASDRLLMSGDHGRVTYDEVNTMKAYAMDAGVPSECVFMDHAGFSTYESVYRTRDIFIAKRVIIVTQDYHLPRALYIAQALGLDAYGVAAAPSREYYAQPYRDAREFIARAKDFLYCVVKPEPSFLGDPIPVFGDGDVTNDK